MILTKLLGQLKTNLTNFIFGVKQTKTTVVSNTEQQVQALNNSSVAAVQTSKDQVENTMNNLNVQTQNMLKENN